MSGGGSGQCDSPGDADDLHRGGHPARHARAGSGLRARGRDVRGHEHFFVRGRLVIPVTDAAAGTEFDWGVWVSLSRDNFTPVLSLWTTPGREREQPYFGWLSTELPLYQPSTLSLKTHVHTQAVGQRPVIELEPTDHPLALEQRTGITLARVQEIAETLLHDLPDRLLSGFVVLRCSGQRGPQRHLRSHCPFHTGLRLLRSRESKRSPAPTTMRAHPMTVSGPLIPGPVPPPVAGAPVGALAVALGVADVVFPVEVAVGVLVLVAVPLGVAVLVEVAEPVWGSQRNPLLSSQMIASPLPVTPDMP